MSNWEKVAKSTGAEFVAGELIARIDNENVSLGHKHGSAVVLTAAGEAIAQQLEARGRKAKSQAAKDAVEDEPLLDTALPEVLSDAETEATS